MSTIRIRVDKEVVTDGGPAPRLFARIQKLNPEGRSTAEHVGDAWVPVSSDARAAEVIALALGDYRVEVTMPSGELLSEAVRLADATPYDVVLTPTAPVQVRGRLQQLVSHGLPRIGVIPKSQYQARSAPDNAWRLVRSVGADGEPRMRGGSVSVLGYARGLPSVFDRVGLSVNDGRVTSLAKSPEARWAADRTASVEVGRPLHWLGKGPAKYNFDVLRTDPWTALPSLRGATANIIDVLNAGRPEILLPPSADNEDAAIFSIDPPPDSGESNFQQGERDYVVVHRRTGVELICLPTPWRDQWTGRGAPVNVTVQRPTYESEFASAVSVEDPHLAFLIGFLQSGALPAAKQLAEHASEILYEKGVNPLAAAAGGYALVSSAVDTQRQRWHGWIENLMERYEHLPDGAIQYATMRLRLRSSSSDIDRAADAFKSAYRRGLPFYGMGMRWLLDGLERLGERDEEAKQMATSVRQVTARLHPTSAFTIIRLGRI